MPITPAQEPGKRPLHSHAIRACCPGAASHSLTHAPSGEGCSATAVTTDQLVQTLLGGLAIGCIYSLIALGISMIIRATEILHFAQGEIMMIGAMTGITAFWLAEMPFVLVLLF